MIGQAGDAIESRTLADGSMRNGGVGWTEVAKRSNIVGSLLTPRGSGTSTTRSRLVRVLRPGAHPELKDVNRLEWLIANTDRDKVYWEPDILHSYSGADRFPKSDGSRFDPFQWVMTTEADDRVPPQGRRPGPGLGRGARG